MKKIADLSPYTNVLPYASEIFGVYQPMLGWRSKRTLKRIERGFSNDLSRAYEGIYRRLQGKFEFVLNDDRSLKEIRAIEPASVDLARTRSATSFVIENLAGQLPPLAEYDDSVWDRVIQPERVREVLTKVVVPRTTDWYKGSTTKERRAAAVAKSGPEDSLAEQLSRESTIAGYVLYLKANKHFDKLKQLFYKPDHRLTQLTKLLSFKSPLDYFDPFKDIDRVGLSPIGIVHLFRQYFFEFDTFLGPSVSHVWMSPGSTVELVEINTRKTIVEKTIENSLESIVKTEKSLTEEDEISDAVKEDNKSDTKFGFNASANQSWVGGSATASSSIDMGSTQSKAREHTHRHMRQQSEKLSTEIRRNFKSTFKMVTEVTDTSSKRYVLNNSTQELINYELRRKMRQVGVQVQDIGTYLCWQTYVDDPGRHLGIARLVHVAKGPELESVPPPEQIPLPQPVTTELPIDIPFEPRTEDTLLEDDDAYADGKEVVTDTNEEDRERIRANFGPYTMMCSQPGYHFGEHGVLEFDYQGNDVRLSVRERSEDPAGTIHFKIHVEHIHFHGRPTARVLAKVTWLPLDSTVTDVNTKNQEKVDAFTEKTKQEYEKAFVEAARERIKFASNIEPRKFEDLREEERIVVYRSLIQEMLTNDLPMPDDRTRHVVAELLNTIFDVDKMLYFVAPEWWRPRLHRSGQALGGIRQDAGAGLSAASGGAGRSIHSQLKAASMKNVSDALVSGGEDSQVGAMDTVTWGGVNENREDNYYITEESTPAKLGSSLGWLLQLDGDNMRNAFLNAPWVKAVLPIRPGQERAAMNWLERLHVEGTDGLDDNYVAPPDQLAKIPHSGPAVTIRDAIKHLCDVVKKKHQDALKVDRYPSDEIHDDNKVSATPVDKVYEHGFYPLQGGFRALSGGEDFEVFDQWIEVLPTDQVVPVEVTYDPKTGRQI